MITSTTASTAGMDMGPLSAISVILGVLGALLLLSMRVFPQRWARMYADAGRESGRPKWAWLTIIGSLLGIVLTWYLHLTNGSEFSLAIAILVTFLLARTAQALLSKKGLRQNVQVFLQGKEALSFLSYSLVSIALVILGLL